MKLSESCPHVWPFVSCSQDRKTRLSAIMTPVKDLGDCQRCYFGAIFCFMSLKQNDGQKRWFFSKGHVAKWLENSHRIHGTGYLHVLDFCCIDPMGYVYIFHKSFLDPAPMTLYILLISTSHKNLSKAQWFLRLYRRCSGVFVIYIWAQNYPNVGKQGFLKC